ncbi:MAG: Uma2 family endonuclease [Acidobacteriaceae bacterium]|nr:Uma2 family endonuclease [Acidobacteriaceae bacterium]
MATAPAPPRFVSVEEYLKTSYRPDCDYVDGVVEERNLGERDHSWIQLKLGGFFLRNFAQSGIIAMPDWRFQVSPTRFRVPDLVVVRGKPDEKILTKQPLLCIEILSPEDRLSRTNTRVRDYLKFGVPAVWVIDPAEKKVWIYRPDGMTEASGEVLRVDGTEVDVPFSEIFD